MICTKCNSESLRVVEKRDMDNEPAIRRRRECMDCGFRFTTYERLEVPLLTIVKKGGQKEPFSREKLAVGIYRAIEKRPIDDSVAEELISSIEKDLKATGEIEISSVYIGETVLSRLLPIDEVAYLRFASVYRSFESLESFAEALKNIKKSK
jgi:transcriptional repressor NrdR